MTQYQILQWRDIPAQVRVFVNGRPRSYPLPDRFQEEIDRVAMREGLTGTDAYLSQWQWGPKLEREGPPDTVAREVVGEVVAAYDARASGAG